MTTPHYGGDTSGRGRTGAPRYRLISTGADVDESLFGTSTARSKMYV